MTPITPKSDYVELGRIAATPPGQIFPVPAGATIKAVAYDARADQFIAYGVLNEHSAAYSSP